MSELTCKECGSTTPYLCWGCALARAKAEVAKVKAELAEKESALQSALRIISMAQAIFGGIGEIAGVQEEETPREAVQRLVDRLAQVEEERDQARRGLCTTQWGTDDDFRERAKRWWGPEVAEHLFPKGVGA